MKTSNFLNCTNFYQGEPYLDLTCVTTGISRLCSAALDGDIQYCIVSPFLSAPSPICISQVRPRLTSLVVAFISLNSTFNQS